MRDDPRLAGPSLHDTVLHSVECVKGRVAHGVEGETADPAD